MIEIQEVRMLNISIQDNDIDTFLTLIEKLLVACKQTGFKKPFNDEERELIEGISKFLNINKPEEGRINSIEEQVKEIC